MTGKIELRPEDAANGWTEESLRAYIASRDIAASRIITHDPEARKPAMPKRANSRYNPHRWRS